MHTFILHIRPDMLSCLKAIADEVEGENVLIVTHGDGVNASVTRIWPWAIAHPVLHTGFTVAVREREEGTTCFIFLSTALMSNTWLLPVPALALQAAIDIVGKHYCRAKQNCIFSDGHASAHSSINAIDECNSKD